MLQVVGRIKYQPIFRCRGILYDKLSREDLSIYYVVIGTEFGIKSGLKDKEKSLISGLER